MSSSVDRWLGRLSPRTGVEHFRVLRGWLKWLKGSGGRFAAASPDELVAWQRRAVGEDRYVLLDLIQRYVSGLEGVRAGTRKRYYAALRSFFMHNRAELPEDRGFKIRGDVPRVVGSLSLDMFRRVVETSNPMYRAFFLCMFQAGMGVGEALYWSRTGLEQVRRQLRAGERPLRIDLPGRKMSRNTKPYYTFIGRDAIDALENWLDTRPEGGGAIFLTTRRTPLTYRAVFVYWHRRLRRLGLVSGSQGTGPRARYGKNLHEIRDLFRTRWRPSGADVEVAEFLMGHDIDRLGYDKSPWHYPEWFEEQYLKAEPWLNIVSEEPEKVHVRELHRLRREYEARLREVERRVEAFQETVRREMEELRRIERM